MKRGYLGANADDGTYYLIKVGLDASFGRAPAITGSGNVTITAAPAHRHFGQYFYRRCRFLYFIAARLGEHGLHNTGFLQALSS